MEYIKEHDLSLGLLCGLRLLGGQTHFGYDDVLFSTCYYAAYRWLEIECEAATERLEISLYMKPHYIHGDSRVAVDGLQRHQSIAPLEAPRYNAFNLRLSVDEARSLLAQIPGSEALWMRVAEAFTRTYAATPLHP